MFEVSDLIEHKGCTEKACSCPFCISGISRIGLVLEKWVDIDDNHSIIGIFDSTEIVIRENQLIPWSDSSSYKKVF